MQKYFALHQCRLDNNVPNPTDQVRCPDLQNESTTERHIRILTLTLPVKKHMSN